MDVTLYAGHQEQIPLSIRLASHPPTRQPTEQERNTMYTMTSNYLLQQLVPYVRYRTLDYGSTESVIYSH